MFKYLVFIFLLTLTSCHVFRALRHGLPGIRYYKFVPAAGISKSERPYNYPDALPDHREKVLEILDTMRFRGARFNDLLDSSRTVAFLVIKNDSLLYENYRFGYHRESMISVFSVTKSYLSALTGIALQEGKLKSLDQPVTDYLPELRDTAFRHVKIRNLMNMTSGMEIRMGGVINVFNGPAKYLYSSNIKDYYSKIRLKEKPGKTFAYSNLNAQLMGTILERATGTKLTDYFESRIWQKIGTEYDATWTYDNQKKGTVKAFCGLNMRAIDLAKFGSLYLHNGNFRGNQIIQPEWIDTSTKVLRDRRFCYYNDFWWHYCKRDLVYTEKGPENDTTPLISQSCYCEKITVFHDYLAEGLLGEFMYVFPEKNIIIIRLGKRYSPYDRFYATKRANWREILNKIARTF